MPNSYETYTDAKLCAAILKKDYSKVGREFIDDMVTVIRHNAFYNCSSLDLVSCPNATVIGRQAFYGCKPQTVELPWSQITAVHNRGFFGASSATANPTGQSSLVLSALAFMDDYAFANNGSYTATEQLTSFSAPLLEELPGYALRYQTGLVRADFAVGIPTGNSAFEGCTSLQTVRFGGPVTVIKTKLFYNCTNLETLILDGVTAVPTVNSNAFTGTKIAAGTGYVYVPRALISAFEAKSGWSTFNFRAIEDYTSLLTA